jgi:hypothetical protein
MITITASNSGDFNGNWVREKDAIAWGLSANAWRSLFIGWMIGQAVAVALRGAGVMP